MPIKAIQPEEVEPLVKEAKAEGLSFNNSTHRYWGYYVNGRIVGFVGAFYRGKGTVVLKNGFVKPEFRGQGIYKKLNMFRLRSLKNEGVRMVETNATEMSKPLHLSLGAKVIKEFKICTMLRYEDFQQHDCFRSH